MTELRAPFRNFSKAHKNKCKLTKEVVKAFFQGLSPHGLTMGHQLHVSLEATCLRVCKFVPALICQYNCSPVKLIRLLLYLTFSYTKQTRACIAKIAPSPPKFMV